MFKRLLNSSLFWLVLPIVGWSVFRWVGGKGSGDMKSLIDGLVVGLVVVAILSFLTFVVRKFDVLLSNMLLVVVCILAASVFLISRIGSNYQDWQLGFFIPVVFALVVREIRQKLLNRTSPAEPSEG